MTSVYMWDDVTPSLIPADAEYVGYYVDGKYANGSQVSKDFPKARLIGIAVRQADDADVLDVESGDATNADVYYWLRRQLTRKISGPVAAPVVYTSVSNVDTLMTTMNANKFVHGRDFVIWSAHYTGTAHVCGPSTCGQCRTPVDATQFTSKAMGRSLDESLVSPSFLAPATPAHTDPKPVTPVTLAINGVKIALEPGKTYTLTVS